MEIVPIFELPNSKLLTVKFDGEMLDDMETLQGQWGSTEFLREFFEKFNKDYYA